MSDEAAREQRRRRVVVTGASGPLGPALVNVLAAGGADVGILDDAPFPSARRPGGPAPVGVGPVVVADLGDREGVRRAFAELAGALGGLDAYVHAPAVEPPPAAGLAGMDDSDFARAWEAPVLATLWCLQGAFAAFGGGPGSVVVVLPTLGMSGAPGLAATSAATEAQRVLAKSAARQWGGSGITVNCVAVEPRTFFGPGVAVAPVSLAPPALEGCADAASVAEVVAMLAGAGARALTGATLCADGGVWMAP